MMKSPIELVRTYMQIDNEVRCLADLTIVEWALVASIVRNPDMLRAEHVESVTPGFAHVAWHALSRLVQEGWIKIENKGKGRGRPIQYALTKRGHERFMKVLPHVEVAFRKVLDGGEDA